MRAIAFAILAATAAGAALGQPPACRAIDGDTIRCGAETIRLRRVYAAELREPGGPEAKARLQALLESGTVTLERSGARSHGRTLAHVYVDGRRIVQRDIGPRAGKGSR